MAKAGGGAGRGGFAAKGPKAYAATVGGRKLNERQFRDALSSTLKKILAAQRPYRRTQGAWRRLEKQRDAITEARSFDLLKRPSGTRSEVYARAVRIIDQWR